MDDKLLNLAELAWHDSLLFDQVEEPMVRKFMSMGFNIRYQAGASLVSNNDFGETFFFLLQGLAKLVLYNMEGDTINVTLFRPGDFFGELSLLETHSIRTGTVLAVSEVEVLTIHKKDFLKVLYECPQLSINLSRNLGQRLRTMNERMITDRLPDDLHKVAHTLVLLATKGKQFSKEGAVLLPPLSLKEWALFCYTSVDAFLNSMERLKEMGALEWQNQRIVITSMKQLKACADEHVSQIQKASVQSSD